MKHKEFEMLHDAIEDVRKEVHCMYEDLSGIVLIHGPGSFTGTRVTCLVIQTIAHAHDIPLYPVDYFSFLQYVGHPYPHVIQANKREARILQEEATESQIMSISDIAEDACWGSADVDLFSDQGIHVYTEHRYETCIKNLILDRPVSRVHPIYIKDPNITLRKDHAR